MRSIYCGHLNSSHIGKEVILCGWVNRRRDLGNLIFIDIRDQEGIVQVFFDSKYKDVFSLALELRNEFCLQITGIVRARPNNQINVNMKTGKIEVMVTKFKIFSKSESLPIDIKNNKEEHNLKFRYLDLRRPKLASRIKIRSSILNFVHYFMNKENFLNIETPILTKFVPEGARDYLVPSRIHKGKFYALPQSPQLFKQLLMISGFDKYYQIVKCFRDEDLRSDRQPEFTQIDMELSFSSKERVLQISEKFIRSLWSKITGVDIGIFPRIKYFEAISRFGSDKPDLRNPIEIIDIEDLVKDIDLEIIHSYLKNKDEYRIVALRIPNSSTLNMEKIYKYIKYIEKYNIKATWLNITEYNSLNGTVAKESIISYLKKDIVEQIAVRINASYGDIVFICSGHKRNVSKSLGSLREKIGLDFKLIKNDCWRPLWITDFPMFKRNSNGKISSVHHPFTSPKSDIQMIKKNPLLVLSNAYDMVINGYEIGSGSSRINCPNMQKAVLDILGVKVNNEESGFDFFIDALKYGTPPHAGIAFGLDRITMLLTKTDNIRDVIAFPKTTSASDLMMNIPSVVDDIDVLNDLGILVSTETK